MEIKKAFNKDKVFFTSDTHFFHNNIIKYCDRPFKSIEEMNETLIKNWNKTIPEDGIVFHLGDFSLSKKSDQHLLNIIHRLNGTIHLIVGNHENDVLKSDIVLQKFKSITDVLEIYVEDKEITYKKQHIVLCHYPMVVWNASHRGSWQLFGHVHGMLSNKGTIQHPTTSMDVGVDTNNYTPYSYQEVKEKITKQSLNKNK